MMDLSRIGELVDGNVVSPTGDKSGDALPILSEALPLSDCTATAITLVDSVGRMAEFLAGPAPVAVVSRDLAAQTTDAAAKGGKWLVVVERPHTAFEKLIFALRPPRPTLGHEIHSTAVIGADAAVAANVAIGAYAVIGRGVTIGENSRIAAGVQIGDDCRLGRDCQIMPRAVLYDGCRVGDRVIIHAGAVVGAWGFGYRQVDGRHERTAQLGWVEIESDVEIGANTAIDRGTYGPTRIARGTKIDNLVQVGHNVHLGPHNLICAHVGLAGSSSTGSHVVLGGQVGLRDHIRVGDRTMVGAQAGIAADLPADGTFVGSPAQPHKEALQSMLAMQRLPEMRKTLRTLQSQVAELLRSAPLSCASDETQKAA